MSSARHDHEPQRKRTPQRRSRQPRSETPTDGNPATGSLEHLQAGAGNRAVAELIQAKRRVGAVDDPLEREADRVAKHVVAGLREGGTPAGDVASDQPATVRGRTSAAPAVARQADSDAGGAEGGQLSTVTEAAITGAGGGQSLDADVQRSMDAGFGADFSGVRVHDDAAADAVNRELNSRAFTAGNDIFFRSGEYQPASTGGQELLAHELTHVVQQGAAGGQADHVHRSADTDAVQRKAYDIGKTGEKLEVSFFTAKSKRVALVKEASEIIEELRTSYGVSVSSSTTVQAIDDDYDEVTRKVRNSLRTRPWRIEELRALRRALAFYADILGANRATSTRASSDQEVTSVGKVKQAIDKNTSAGKLDTTTLGEYFASKKNMGLFKASEHYVADFDNLYDQLTGTFVHEVAHGLLAYAIPDYIKETGYWKDRNTERPKPRRTESPITEYGETNAAEDLCESAMMYFIAPKRLQAACPLRYAFMVKIGTAWLPPPTEAPQVQPDAPGTAPKTTASTPSTPPQASNALDEVEKIVDEVNRSATSTTDTASDSDASVEQVTIDPKTEKPEPVGAGG